MSLPRPRDRVALADDARYAQCRSAVLEFPTIVNPIQPSMQLDSLRNLKKSAKKLKLVVIGNGMAGIRTLEELFKLAPDLYDVTVFGAEPHPNFYNRISLSPGTSRRTDLEEIVLNDLEMVRRLQYHAASRQTG